MQEQLLRALPRLSQHVYMHPEGYPVQEGATGRDVYCGSHMMFSLHQGGSLPALGNTTLVYMCPDQWANGGCFASCAVGWGCPCCSWEPYCKCARTHQHVPHGKSTYLLYLSISAGSAFPKDARLVPVPWLCQCVDPPMPVPVNGTFAFGVGSGPLKVTQSFCEEVLLPQLSDVIDEASDAMGPGIAHGREPCLHLLHRRPVVAFAVWAPAGAKFVWPHPWEKSDVKHAAGMQLGRSWIHCEHTEHAICGSRRAY